MHINVAPGTPVEDVDAITKAVRIVIHDNVAGAFCVIRVDPATTTPLATSSAAPAAWSPVTTGITRPRTDSATSRATPPTTPPDACRTPLRASHS